MAKAPVRHGSSRELDVFGNIAKHFNNPATSDLTVTVGDQSFYVHRFILSAQSGVFDTMLMNRQWKESVQKVIELDESPECVAVFGDFLKFFYIGKLTLSCDNVCAIHMLADKYDLPLLKEDAVAFMEDVLTGLQDKVFPSAVVWLPYIEMVIPDLLPVCYDAMRTNFYEIANCNDDKTTSVLESQHINAILARKGSDVVVPNELLIFQFVSKWAKLKFENLSGRRAKKELKPVLESIRFYNINAKGLQKIEQSPLCNAIGKSFLSNYTLPAYKVHSQMLHIVSMNGKEKSSGNATDEKHTCPFDSGDNCSHLNPRLYTQNLYGRVSGNIDPKMSFMASITPIDLADLQMYANVQFCLENSTNNSMFRKWRFECKGNYQTSESYDNETFTLKPRPADIGRKYTVAVIAVYMMKTCLKYRYAIKHTGTVGGTVKAAITISGPRKFHCLTPDAITLHSPKRPKGIWDISKPSCDYAQRLLLGVAVHLHKQ